MPIYNYICLCGLITELVRGYDTGSVVCPKCNRKAIRASVYEVAAIFKGGDFTKSTMPPPPTTPEEHAVVNEEMSKEMKRRNYQTDRVYDDLRGAKTQDKEGRPQVDTRKLKSEA